MKNVLRNSEHIPKKCRHRKKERQLARAQKREVKFDIKGFRKENKDQELVDIEKQILSKQNHTRVIKFGKIKSVLVNSYHCKNITKVEWLIKA